MNTRPRVAVIGAMLILATACGGGGATSPTATPEPTSTPTPTPVASATSEPSPSAASGEATLDAPATVDAGADFEVAWTGPNGRGDYVTVVAAGTTEWTDEDYFSTSAGSPGTLTAPLSEGDYEIWYVSGADHGVLASASLTVTPFTGDLLAPDEVAGGTDFEVAWNGPNGSGDYITIVPPGADTADYWSYWDAYNGSPGTLVAPVSAGEYEIWYVTGSPREVMLRRPITVLPVSASISGPSSVTVGSEFEIEWTGPNGPGDYLTIVPVGAEPNAYLSYWDAYNGSPGMLTAPDEPGAYELWYVTPARRHEAIGIQARRPIEVTP